MSHSRPAPTANRRARPTFGTLVVVVVAVLLGVVGHQALTASSSATSPVTELFSHLPHGRLLGDRHGAFGRADGVVPDGVTVFDDAYPAVTRLDPALLVALRHAATAAAADHVQLFVNSGWRSRAYQDELLHEAVAKYGSEREAARWVATAETSPHVSGEAVDIGRADAAAWLAEGGAAYGLCRIYDNEPWHFELRPEAVGHGCPRRYADPTHDPRMQQ